MLKNLNWKDYEILELGNAHKIERFGRYILKRPEPLAPQKQNLKTNYDSEYDGNQWSKNLEPWTINYKDMTFKLEPGTFKHLGIFPEQADNWDWIRKTIQKIDDAMILNLFAYTGGATIAAAKERPKEIVHLDALKSSLERAKENARLNNVDDQKIRYIKDDAIKFLQREQRRNRQYSGIIMDPPSFGRGPKGEMWKIKDHLPKLIDLALTLLEDQGEFLIINTYSTDLSKANVNNILKKKLKEHNLPNHTKAYDLSLPQKDSQNVLNQGQTVRWAINEDYL